jgi:hypothetical protein
MGRVTTAPDEDSIARKWAEMAEAIDRLAERIGDPDDFPVLAGSSLAGDDGVSHPFEVSQAVRHLINASVDQLHGIKTLLHETKSQHLAVGSTLARAALENTAAAIWILGPRRRNVRIERVLRWHARNYSDQRTAVGHLLPSDPTRHHDLIRVVAVSRGIDPKVAASGYKITGPIEGAEEFTSIEVKFPWAVASGFAHGRPWAFELLAQEKLRIDEGHEVRRITPRTELAIWLPLQAMHLLGELLRLRDRRAGLPMPRMPDGTPDSEFPRSRSQ